MKIPTADKPELLTAQDLKKINAALLEYGTLEIQRTPDGGLRVIGKKIRTIFRRPEK